MPQAAAGWPEGAGGGGSLAREDDDGGVEDGGWFELLGPPGRTNDGMAVIDAPDRSSTNSPAVGTLNDAVGLPSSSPGSAMRAITSRSTRMAPAPTASFSRMCARGPFVRQARAT
ncbi:hypothetical protein [Kibdelosporangium philippinense]|uniref:hypothetical protein n=1 Tax=Kibdelosporangium philippinense TaxID=211113 RepID=UPI00361A52C8